MHKNRAARATKLFILLLTVSPALHRADSIGQPRVRALVQRLGRHGQLWGSFICGRQTPRVSNRSALHRLGRTVARILIAHRAFFVFGRTKSRQSQLCLLKRPSKVASKTILNHIKVSSVELIQSTRVSAPWGLSSVDNWHADACPRDDRSNPQPGLFPTAFHPSPAAFTSPRQPLPPWAPRRSFRHRLVMKR